MSTVRTIMNARAKQRKTSLAVKGFKCQEIGYKRYTSLKNSLKVASTLIEKYANEKENEKGNETLLIWHRKRKELKKQIKEYEKKNNIKETPKKVLLNHDSKAQALYVTKEKKGFMSKVRSLFSRRK